MSLIDSSCLQKANKESYTFVTVRTDHAALSFKQPEGQLGRWLEVISEYDIKIVHRAGRSMTTEICFDKLSEIAAARFFPHLRCCVERVSKFLPPDLLRLLFSNERSV